MRFTPSKNLPRLVDIIGQQHLSGWLVASTRPAISLYFEQGRFVRIEQGGNDASADDILHVMLGDSNFNLAWHLAKAAPAAHNVSADTRAAFADVLHILTSNGEFLAPDLSELEADFFSPPATQAEQYEADNTGPVELIGAVVDARNPGQQSYAIATHLLLPPGQHQAQWEELLTVIGFKEQLQTLSRAHFTGYVHYCPKTDRATKGGATRWGVVLFNNGQITDVQYVIDASGLKQSGVEALKSLAIQKFAPQVYKVEPNVLRAYRAFISHDTPTREVAATRDNFARVVTNFKNSRRDGLAMVYFDKLKLHYFFLFSEGEQVGVFGPEASTGKLQPLSAPLALPMHDDRSSMTILLATRPGGLKAATPAAVLPTTSPVTPVAAPIAPPAPVEAALPEAISWDGMFKNGPSLEKSLTQDQTAQAKRLESETSSRKSVDTNNPFDF